MVSQPAAGTKKGKGKRKNKGLSVVAKKSNKEIRISLNFNVGKKYSNWVQLSNKPPFIKGL